MPCLLRTEIRVNTIPSNRTIVSAPRYLACRAASDHDRPTGDVQDNTGDPRCIIRCEIERRVGDVFWCSETLDRMQVDEILLLSRGYAPFVLLGEDCFRSNAVRTDSVRTYLAGEVLRQNFYPGLGGCIRDRRHRIRPARGGRRNRNDVAGSALLHARQEAFDGEEGRGEIAVDRCSPLLLARLLDWAGRGEAAAGIGDEDVERPEFPFNPAAHGFDIAEL